MVDIYEIPEDLESTMDEGSINAGKIRGILKKEGQYRYPRLRDDLGLTWQELDEALDILGSEIENVMSKQGYCIAIRWVAADWTARLCNILEGRREDEWIAVLDMHGLLHDIPEHGLVQVAWRMAEVAEHFGVAISSLEDAIMRSRDLGNVDYDKESDLELWDV